MRKSISIIVVALLLLVSLLSASVWASEIGDKPRFAYVANSWDYIISGYAIDENGLLQPNGGTYTNVKLIPMLITHPSGKFIYTASRTVDTLPAYKVNQTTGQLTEIEGSPFDAGVRSPFQYSFHPSGKFLYMAARSGAVAGYVVNQQTGALKLVPGSPFKAGERTRSLAVHPSGKFVYATNAYTNDISVYSINQQTGALTEINNSPFNAGENVPFDDSFAPLPDAPQTAIGLPYYVAIHPSGNYAYVTNWRASSISMFRLDQQTGAMTLIDKPVTTGLTPYPVAVHPSGKYVYASGWASNDVWVYAVEQKTGKLTLIDDSQTEIKGLKPIAIRFNGDGTMAYIPTLGSNSVSVLSVDLDTGRTTLEQTIRARAGPVDVAIVDGSTHAKAKSNYAFVVDKNSASLIVHKVDSNNGDFVEVDRAKVGDAQDVAHNPVKGFVYTANTDSKTLSGFVVNEKTGKLSPIKGFPYAMDIEPSDIAIDAFGLYLYVKDKNAKVINVFLIHKDTGQIAEVRDSPIQLQQAANSMSLDYTARFAYFTNPASNSLTVYRHLKSITAALYQIENLGSPFSMPGSISGFVTNPDGKHGIAIYADNDSVALYKINEGSGGLYDLEKQLHKHGRKPVAAKFSPKGKYVYVLNEQSSDIAIYAIDRLAGTMTYIGNTPTNNKNPSDLQIDPSGKFVYVSNRAGKPVERFIRDSITGRLTSRGVVAKELAPVSLSISRRY